MTEKYLGFFARDSFDDCDYINNEIANTYMQEVTR